MDPCQTYADWHAEDDGERLHSLTDLINNAISEWGFDPVSVVNAPVDGAPAEYDSNIIYLDLGDPAFTDARDALSIAYHEVMHAVLDQAGVDIEGLAEELQAGFLGSRAADEGLEGCECGEPVESSGDSSAPPFPFRCDLEGGF